MDNIEQGKKKPIQLKNVNLAPLRKICQEYIDELDKNGCADDDDYDHYIYIFALECVFGKDIWDWINEKEA
jgi:hypothetical protein